MIHAAYAHLFILTLAMTITHSVSAQAEECLKLEEERVENYLHSTTKVGAVMVTGSRRSQECRALE